AQHHPRNRSSHPVPHAQSFGKRISCLYGRRRMTPTENTPVENTPMSPELERAMSEIREEAIDPAAIEAAAARVWTKLADTLPGTHLRTCADFQALIPEFRARRLSPARATLLQDHLHQCVACRKVYEGRVV